MDFSDILRNAAERYAGHIAVTDGEASYTYAVLYDRAVRLANALAELGVRRGDRVATLEDNSIQSLERICAFALGGFVRVPMYARTSLGAHSYALNLVEAKALIVDGRHADHVAGILSNVPALKTVITDLKSVITDSSRAMLHYEQLIRNASSQDPGARLTEEDAYIIRFSSGTTGRPKGILHSQGRWAQMANELTHVLPQFTEDDAYLVAAPMSHAAGMLVWPLIASGSSHIIESSFNPEYFLQSVERERASITFLVPTMIIDIINHPEASKYDLSSLRSVIYGGAPIAEATQRAAIELWGNVMFQIYGQSECPNIAVLPPQWHRDSGTGARRIRSVGRPTPNGKIKIVDGWEELPAGQLGEVAAQVPGRMTAIWRDPSGTAEVMNEEGFIRTRDSGYLDEAGFLFLSDRMDDMIISGGFNIWPAEVENALASHPGVVESAVFGRVHPRWGEEVVAVVVLRPGHQQVSEADLVRHCADELGSMKKPARILFSDVPLPRNPVGKLSREDVRSAFLQLLDAPTASVGSTEEPEPGSVKWATTKPSGSRE